MASPEEILPIVDYLIDLSCCPRCILRFLGQHAKETFYLNPKEYFNSLIMTGDKDPQENIKKLKSNVCPVCLDCYKDSTIEKITEQLKTLDLESYDYSNFFFNVSFPKCIAVRAHSILLHLKNKFPNYRFGNLYETTSNENVPLLEPPHKIFRVISSKALSEVLNRPCHPKSQLSLLICLGYEDDDIEVKNLKDIINNTKKNQHIRISRNNIPEFLKETDEKMFKSRFSVPPEIPNTPVSIVNIEINAEPLFLGGRYFKFKRNVGQTPWIKDGQSVTDYNVQDEVFKAVSSVLGFDYNSMTFTASGREDVDVRMLGTGRPFYIKIDNPKRRKFLQEDLHKIERMVIQSELVAITNLQTVPESELRRIKHGEEQKRKTYKAICKTTCPNVKEAISVINKHGESQLNVTQLTVMRVLHRRTLLPRNKIIYHMTAEEIPGHSDLFELVMVTQAGAYVKEFVHGDFKRTQPNISSLIGYPTDMIALDCIDIDLAWP
ncbi:hypothetical protein ABEB36_012014 [Hypothenemus hampei]|uniref:tRNA pseudouridine(55) synthase n=1 Tax=Hypothenemus hampei TaxID=57062 RepID=A0ABD1EA26_HYPHA